MSIKVRIEKDSLGPSGVRLTTFVLEYPRFIHSELMTHRVFSRNASSSRAIPVSKIIDNIENDIAMPVHWGKNQKGMQAREEHSEPELGKAIWKSAMASGYVGVTILLLVLGLFIYIDITRCMCINNRKSQYGR